MIIQDKNRYILRCDNCGKENRIKRVNIDEKIVNLAKENKLYCQNCDDDCRDQNKAAIVFMAGSLWTVERPYSDLSETELASFERAKGILSAGLEIIKKESDPKNWS